MRAVILVAVLTLGAFGVVAFAQTPKAPDCTWVGTPTRDVKTGTSGANVLCPLGGGDFVHGKAGNDVVKASAGRDTIVGGGGRDRLFGGGGRDRIFAVDDRGGELVVGGPGVDQCFIDPSDRTRGCEHTFRSNEPEMATALAVVVGSVMEIAEELPTVTPGPIPPPVITILPPPNCGGHPAPPPIC